MDLTATESVVAGTAVVTLSGSVDLGTVPHLSDVLGRAVLANRGRLVAVDLDGVTALDDTGLGVLLGAAGRARDAGGDVAIVCADAQRRERLARSGLDRALTVARAIAELVPGPR